MWRDHLRRFTRAESALNTSETLCDNCSPPWTIPQPAHSRGVPTGAERTTADVIRNARLDVSIRSISSSTSCDPLHLWIGGLPASDRAARDGWGLFSQISFADRATSPITVFFDVGLRGNGVFSGRPRDEFGVAYAYTDLSEDLKLNLLTLGGRPVQSEHQLEMFYNVHLAPWLQLTGDLQIIRPTRSAAETAAVPGVRLRIVF